MNSAIASANNATLASVASSYALQSVVSQLSIDLADQKVVPYPNNTDLNTALASRTTPLDVDMKIANALLTYVQQVALDAALAIRDGRLDAAEAAIAALQAAGFQTAADVAGRGRLPGTCSSTPTPSKTSTPAHPSGRWCNRRSSRWRPPRRLSQRAVV